MINIGDLSAKPGWVRISIHPTMSDSEVDFIINSLSEVVINHEGWSADYTFDSHLGDYTRLNRNQFTFDLAESFKNNQ